MLHQRLDGLFHALADPTRRAMVERLAQSPASVSTLAEPFEMSLSAIGQHVALLEACGLVRSSKQGRVRTVELVPEALAAGERWFTDHQSCFRPRADQQVEPEHGAETRQQASTRPQARRPAVSRAP